MFYCWYKSPIGRILLAGDDRGLSYLLFERGKHCQTTGIDPDWSENDKHFGHVVHQLNQYFDGERTTFDIKLRLDGTAFQQRVWAELAQIPFGQTISYATLASKIGQPGASRAVGSANGKNPVSIIIPCHRVIGSDNRLAGYGGGLSNKVQLLRLEGLHVADADDQTRAKVTDGKQMMLPV